MVVCPGCGGENPPGSRFCNACGVPLPLPVPAHLQRKTVTVLFADVTGSTEMGERLDPESLRRVLARFFDAARLVIERHGGTVEKFIGDAVMAVFGIPQLHEDDALRAVRAAADLGSALAALNAELRRDFGTELRLRTGVNTGEVVTGTEERLATGDAVNVAARLEQLAAPGEVLLGEPTVRLVRDAVRAEPLPPAELKGKSGPVGVYRLLEVSATPPARRMDTAMVGRAGQLGLLADAFSHAARDRTCNLFTLLGTAGVGKSRLVAEFLGGVDAAVLRGQCLSYGEGITYWPVVEMVQQLAEPDLPALQAEHPGVAAPISALLGDDTIVTSSADIAWAVRKLYEHVASRRPLVVVFDDLHWAEPTLLDLVEHVTDLSRDRPILLICLARPELLDRRPGWGGGKFNATTVLLEPLTGDETDQLIGKLRPGLEPGLQAQVREAAAGNPLFVEEMLALVETGSVSVPPTIRALLAARLDQLDPAERRVLESGSVEGQSFHRGGVQALDPDEREVLARLTGLVRKDLVRPDRAILPGEDAFRFRHLLIRDAAYDGLPKSVRAELHQRFARWVDEHGDRLVERDEIVGYHLEQAYRYRAELGPVGDAARAAAQDAAGRLAAAGRRGQLRGDMAAAANLLERAIGLLPPEQLDVSLELDYGEALWDCGRLADAVSRIEAAAARADQTGDRIGALQLRLQLGIRLLSTDPEGRLEELRSLVDEARPELERSSDAARAVLWLAIAHIAHMEMDSGAELSAANRAVEFARRAGDLLAAESGLMLANAAIVYGPTPVGEGVTWLERAAREWPSLSAALTGSQGYLLALAGHPDQGRALHRQAEQVFAERGLALVGAIMEQQGWHIEMAAGDPVAAERVIRAGCQQLDRMGERSFLSTEAGQLAQALYHLGRYEEAKVWADRGAELAASDDTYTQVLVRQVWLKLAARQGDFAAARRFADEAVTLVDRTADLVNQGEVALDVAEMLTLAGDPAGAAAQLDKAVDRFRAKGATACVAIAEQRQQKLRTP